MTRVRSLTRAALAVCLATGAPIAATAVQFDVNSTADAGDASIDGTCQSAAGDCTLRAAIQEANATTEDADSIVLPAGKYTLKLVGPFEEDAVTGDLDIGSLAGNDVTITGNKARFDGGGINHVGDDLTLENATFSKNNAADEGGGLQILGSPTALSNVTFSGNKAKGPGGAINVEGETPVTATILSATFSGNKSRDAGGGIASQIIIPTVTSSILSNNKPENCNVPVVSGGGNFESLVQCSFEPANSGIKKLGLASLKANGGLTATHALEADSPAIDGGVDAECPPADQRGTSRFDVPGVGTAICDSGAFEFVP